MADGVITIDVDFPLNKLKKDIDAVNDYLAKLGKNTGENMDDSFKKNADKVVDKAKKTSNQVKNELDKPVKTKFEADNSDLKRKADEARRTTERVPKNHRTKFTGEDHTGGIFSSIHSHFTKIQKDGEKTHSLFRSIFHANMVSNAVTGAFGMVKNAIGGMLASAKQYAVAQQTMNATWLTLTGNASKGKAMVNQINDLAAAAQNSTEMVDQLSQQFYAINNNAKQTGQLTKAVLTLQDAFGKSDAAVQNFGMQFSQMMANGKVSAMDMLSIVNTFPKLKPMLVEYEKRIHHLNKFTSADLSEMMRKGKVSSQDMINVLLEAGEKYKSATGNFTNTIPGMQRVFSAQSQRLLQAIEGPITKAKNPFYGALSKWVSSSKTIKEFDKLGKTFSNGMNEVISALFGGKTVNVAKVMDNALNGITNSLSKIFSWIAKNGKDIKQISGDLVSIAVQIGKNVWKDFSSILTSIGRAFGLVGKNSDKGSSGLHAIAEMLDTISKNKLIIQSISKLLISIVALKGLDRVGSSLFGIGSNLLNLSRGLRGIKEVEGISETGAKFLKAGNGIRKFGSILKTTFKTSLKLGKATFKGIAFASKEMGRAFTQQIKIIGKAIKGLGSGLLKAAKAVGKEAMSAGRFIGSQITAGYKKSLKIGKGLFGKGEGAGIFGGALQSARSAGGFGGLSTAGKITTGLAGIGVAASAGVDIYQGLKSKTKKGKYEGIGKGVGSAIGGGIGLWFGGPLGAAIGAKIGATVGKWGGKAVLNFQKGWKSKKPPKNFWSIENLGYSTHNFFKGFQKGIGNIIKWFKKNWKEIGLYFVNPIAGAINSLYKHNAKFRKWVDGLVKTFKKYWNPIAKWFGGVAKTAFKLFMSAFKGIAKFFGAYVKAVKKVWTPIIKFFGGIGKSAVSTFKKAWDGITHWFGGLVDGIKRTWDNFWGGIKNTIDDLMHGKVKIGPFHFADGTDWRKRYGTLAVLNDGTDSPQTHNRESIIHEDGTIELLPDVPNLKRVLLPGEEVINARDTARLFGNVRHYATGTLPKNISVNINTDKIDPSLFTIKDLMSKSLKLNKEYTELAIKEARRKQERQKVLENKERKEANDKTKNKNKAYKIEGSKIKGSVLVDKGLLDGSHKDKGVATYVNEKLFKRLMSYTKAKPIKINPNSRIRYTPIATRNAGKNTVQVDEKWLTGAKKLTGRYVTITKDAYAKLLQFTRKEREYKLPAKSRRRTSSTRRRSNSSTRRSSSESSSDYSAGSASSNIRASVSGLSSVKALSKAIKAIKSKKVTLTVKIKGSKTVSSFASKIKGLTKKKHAIAFSVKGTKSISKATKEIKSLKSSLKSLYSSAKKYKFGTKIGDQAEKAVKMLKGKGNFAKQFTKLVKDFKDELSGLVKSTKTEFTKMYDDMNKVAAKGIDRISNKNHSFSKSFKSEWKDLEKDVTSEFTHYWSTMQKTARTGLSKVIGVLNNAIRSINKVVAEFGGNKQAIKPVKFASGTGAFSFGVRRPITKPTYAVVNDGNDSPQTGNREALYRPSTGELGVFSGRNVPVMLMPGDEILNATETRELGLTHFASGTGYLKKLYKEAQSYYNHPKKSLKKILNFNHKQNSTAIDQLVNGVFKQANMQVKDWWQQLWDMVQDKIDDGGDTDATGLLKAVEKYGEGHPYVWGATGPDAFDCSGLVQYALGKLGIKYAHYSGSQYAESQKISRSQAKPGDLVFWGSGGSEHVGVYAGGNNYFSAESPSTGIRMNSLDSVTHRPGPLFARVPGLKHKTDDEPSVKAKSKLQKSIKQTVGKGFWKTIDKIADEFGFGNMGGHAATMGMIEAAAKKMHVDLPTGFAKKLMQVIMSESGNRSIMQQIHDVNSGGNEARGVLQFTPLTFKNFAMPGHTNIWNPYDQLLAFFNNSDWRNSIGWTTIWNHQKMDWLHSGPIGHRRFARGGIVSSPETIEVAEAGHPESIVPWDPAQRGRAYAIMQATLDRFKMQDGNAQKFQDQQTGYIDMSRLNAEISVLSDKFDQVLMALGLITSQPTTIQVDNYLDKRVLGQALYQTVNKLTQKNVRLEAHRISGFN